MADIPPQTPAHKHERRAAQSTCEAVAFHLSDPERKQINPDWLMPHLELLSVQQLEQLLRRLVYRKMIDGFRVPAENVELVKTIIARVRS